MHLIPMIIIVAFVIFISGCQTTATITKDHAQEITWYAEDYCNGRNEVKRLSFSPTAFKVECSDGRRADIKIVEKL